MNSPTAATVTIDGNEYKTDDLSEAARQQLVNVRITDREIERLKQSLAIAETARATYARALSEALRGPEH